MGDVAEIPRCHQIRDDSDLTDTTEVFVKESAEGDGVNAPGSGLDMVDLGATEVTSVTMMEKMPDFMPDDLQEGVKIKIKPSSDEMSIAVPAMVPADSEDTVVAVDDQFVQHSGDEGDEDSLKIHRLDGNVEGAQLNVECPVIDLSDSHVLPLNLEVEISVTETDNEQKDLFCDSVADKGNYDVTPPTTSTDISHMVFSILIGLLAMGMLGSVPKLGSVWLLLCSTTSVQTVMTKLGSSEGFTGVPCMMTDYKVVQGGPNYDPVGAAIHCPGWAGCPGNQFNEQ